MSKGKDKPGTFDSERARAAQKKSAESRRKKLAERQRAKQAAKRLRLGMTILEAMDLWPEFKAASWNPWRVFLAGLFGLDVPDGETWQRHTERESAPGEPFPEAWVIVGRRGGKSRIAALVAVYLALFRDYSKVLSRGEVGTVMVLGSDRKQCRVIMGYVKALIEARPELEQMVEIERQEGIEFTNRTAIEIHTASRRSIRGYTCVAALLDEVGHWHDSETSANPADEILAAIRPSMATVDSGVLLCISTPYARTGALWGAFQAYYGKPIDDVLVWKADSKSMNCTLPDRVIEAAYTKDAIAASAEYGAEFRSDVESFVSIEVVNAVTVGGRHEIPAVDGVAYYGFVDPSGGSRDSFTMAVAHVEDERMVLDCTRERKPPFDPAIVTHEYAEVAKRYRLHRIHGDRYAGIWPVSRFADHGVDYVQNAEPKSTIYGKLLPLLNAAEVELLDDPRLRGQLVGLERRTARGGKDSIDHGPHGHDDLVNAVAGVLVMAEEGKRRTPGIAAIGIEGLECINPFGEAGSDVWGPLPS